MGGNLPDNVALGQNALDGIVSVTNDNCTDLVLCEDRNCIAERRLRRRAEYVIAFSFENQFDSHVHPPCTLASRPPYHPPDTSDDLIHGARMRCLLQLFCNYTINSGSIRPLSRLSNKEIPRKPTRK